MLNTKGTTVKQLLHLHRWQREASHQNKSSEKQTSKWGQKFHGQKENRAWQQDLSLSQHQRNTQLDRNHKQRNKQLQHLPGSPSFYSEEHETEDESHLGSTPSIMLKPFLLCSILGMEFPKDTLDKLLRGTQVNHRKALGNSFQQYNRIRDGSLPIEP